MNGQLLEETLCVEHQPDAREWYEPHSDEPDTIRMSAREIYRGVLKYRTSAVRVQRLKKEYWHRRLPRRSIAIQMHAAVSDAQRTFQALANQWKRETMHMSSLTRTSMHPAYQCIIGMGKTAVPFILRELQEHGGHWLWALHAITREDPAPEGSDFDSAVQAWLAWGRRQGYIGIRTERD
jgi:hypothetical protein